MNIVEIIEKKRNKETLTFEELKYAFNGYLNKEIPDYQMSALLMAITLNKMNFEETINLTKIFIDSGETYNFGDNICDKHSTGGIGDTVTLVIAPILSALGVKMAKMSGRGLGITGGTVDKLLSIPGYHIDLTREDYQNCLNKVNIAVGSQTDNLVPLDKVIYALRDVTGTTESISLIASSIMSKKIACGAKNIVIDIKCGEGALIKTRGDANALSDWLIKIGESFNVKVKTLITPMDEPLSSAIGNALEVYEVIDVLKGKSCKLADVAIEIASTLVSMSKDISVIEAKMETNRVLKNGEAYEAFKKWISYQGGNLSKLKISDKIFAIRSNKTGVIKHISALKCGQLSLKLGAGRTNKDSKIDYSVGIKLLKQTGDNVFKGDVLAHLYVNNENINLTDEDLNLFTIV